MKKYLYIIPLSLSLLLPSCKDWMNTVPEGANKTADQKAQAAQEQDEAAKADVNALYAQMIEYHAGLGSLGYTRHNDFGVAATSMILEANGQDFTGYNIGYNWFSQSLYPGVRDNTLTSTNGLVTHMMWNVYYKIIHAANNIIELVDENDPGEQEYALGQAFAVRGYAYLHMAQLYQQTYQVAKDKACVPIVKDRMPAEQQTNNPRATVLDVYNLIMHDLDWACEHLDGFTATSKGSATQAVAYGLRARANLLMGNNAQAAEDAQMALTLSGATPLSIEDCGTPGFCNAKAKNVIWANVVTEDNDITQSGIVNFLSHMSSFYADGYTGVGAYHGIHSALYNQIPMSDVRKGWWLNSELESPLMHQGNYAEMIPTLQSDPNFAYVNVKFGTKDGNTSGLAAAAGDWILMRAEEMHLIIAEATQDGAYLQNFVQQYRDPSYTFSGDVTEAVWMQRRIELWGEGFALMDLLRLHKGITRTNSTNWPAAWMQDIPADHGCLLWRIPQAEIEANAGISEADNNPFVEI